MRRLWTFGHSLAWLAVLAQLWLPAHAAVDHDSLSAECSVCLLIQADDATNDGIASPAQPPRDFAPDNQALPAHVYPAVARSPAQPRAPPQ